MAGMNMRGNLMDIYKILTADETLLRLLYYPATSLEDSPLSASKENILDKSVSDRWAIINDTIKTTSKTTGLDGQKKCRICFYSGIRKPTRNYIIAEQYIYFDVYVHLEIEEIDMRLSWICDRINELLNNDRVTGMGKFLFRDGVPVGSVDGYVQYRLVYSFGDFNEPR